MESRVKERINGCLTIYDRNIDCNTFERNIHSLLRYFSLSTNHTNSILALRLSRFRVSLFRDLDDSINRHSSGISNESFEAVQDCLSNLVNGWCIPVNTSKSTFREVCVQFGTAPTNTAEAIFAVCSGAAVLVGVCKHTLSRHRNQVGRDICLVKRNAGAETWGVGPCRLVRSIFGQTGRC